MKLWKFERSGENGADVDYEQWDGFVIAAESYTDAVTLVKTFLEDNSAAWYFREFTIKEVKLEELEGPTMILSSNTGA